MRKFDISFYSLILKEDEFPKSIGFKFVDLEKCMSSTLDTLEISTRSVTPKYENKN